MKEFIAQKRKKKKKKKRKKENEIMSIEHYSYNHLQDKNPKPSGPFIIIHNKK